VLHIFNDCYPDLFGGALSVIRDICVGLKGAFTACVLVCSKSCGQRRIVVNGVTVERVRSFGDVCSFPAAPMYPLRLWRQAPDYDVLALHAPFPLADLMFALGLGRDRPLVVHYHADSVSHAGLRWFVELLMRRTLRRADAIIVSNAILLYSSPLLQEFAEKCHVVPFGVDASKYDWPVPRLDDDDAERDRARLVLACGQLVPYKGFDVLVRAAVGQRFEVWIVGEGPERARLERLIHSLGVADRVRLLGSAPHAKLVKFMRTADVFALPSVTNAETFGMAQLEAMAAGLPIINTSLDGCSARGARWHRGDHRSTRRSCPVGGSHRSIAPRSGAAPAHGPCRLASRNDAILHRRLPERNRYGLSSCRDDQDIKPVGLGLTPRNNRNGSGKSTLLRLIAAVYPATSGRVDVTGNIVPLLGLNAGANPGLAAADNINLLLRTSGRKPTPAVVDETVNS